MKYLILLLFLTGCGVSMESKIGKCYRDGEAYYSYKITGVYGSSYLYDSSADSYPDQKNIISTLGQEVHCSQFEHDQDIAKLNKKLTELNNELIEKISEIRVLIYKR
jgi:hypothetical protein